MRTKVCGVVAGLGLLAALTAKPVVGHHAFSAEFDAERPVKFKGTVTKMVWVNPHAWIYVDVKRPDGKIEEWMIEAGTPNTLLRRGLTTNTLKPTMQIVVTGFRAKDGSRRANGKDLSYPDGRRILLANPGGDAPAANAQ